MKKLTIEEILKYGKKDVSSYIRQHEIENIRKNRLRFVIKAEPSSFQGSAARMKSSIERVLKEQFSKRGRKPFDSVSFMRIDLIFNSHIYNENDIHNPNSNIPDVDNVAKSILDTTKGILFTDDKIINGLSIHRHFIQRKTQIILNCFGTYRTP